MSGAVPDTSTVSEAGANLESEVEAAGLPGDQNYIFLDLLLKSGRGNRNGVSSGKNVRNEVGAFVGRLGVVCLAGVVIDRFHIGFDDNRACGICTPDQSCWPGTPERMRSGLTSRTPQQRSMSSRLVSNMGLYST